MMMTMMMLVVVGGGGDAEKEKAEEDDAQILHGDVRYFQLLRPTAFTAGVNGQPKPYLHPSQVSSARAAGQQFRTC